MNKANHDRSTSRRVEILHPVRGPGKPMRTVVEIAEILGVSANVLGNALTKDPTAPECGLDNRSRCASSKSRWYEPRAVIAWWKRRSEGKA